MQTADAMRPSSPLVQHLAQRALGRKKAVIFGDDHGTIYGARTLDDQHCITQNN